MNRQMVGHTAMVDGSTYCYMAYAPLNMPTELIKYFLTLLVTHCLKRAKQKD